MGKKKAEKQKEAKKKKEEARKRKETARKEREEAKRKKREAKRRAKEARKRKKAGQVKQIVRFPAKLLQPIGRFLSREARRLERRKKQLATEDPFAHPGRLSDNAAPDSDAAEQVGHERATAMKSQTDKRLIQIKKALARIKIGKYGLCEKCGRMIDTDRLMAMPEATRCIKCSHGA